jgi:hypothetical protein
MRAGIPFLFLLATICGCEQRGERPPDPPEQAKEYRVVIEGQDQPVRVVVNPPPPPTPDPPRGVWLLAGADLVAYETLRDSEVLVWAPVDAGAETPSEVAAFQRLLNSKDAPQIFEYLYVVGTPQAKAYGLAGLYLVGPEALQYHAEKTGIPDVTVEVMEGSVVSQVRLPILFRNPEQNVVRLEATTETIPQWRARNSGSNAYLLDISGGGIPAALRDHALPQ